MKLLRQRMIGHRVPEGVPRSLLPSGEMKETVLSHPAQPFFLPLETTHVYTQSF